MFFTLVCFVLSLVPRAKKSICDYLRMWPNTKNQIVCCLSLSNIRVVHINGHWTEANQISLAMNTRNIENHSLPCQHLVKKHEPLVLLSGHLDTRHAEGWLGTRNTQTHLEWPPGKEDEEQVC